MERFELEDIVAQDKNGIVYAARDSELNRKVSIRRFLPFGQNGGGLDKEERDAFGIAAERLSELEHESLRSIIAGGVDPIDSIPYVVTEWVDGVSLETILADEKMDPALVIDVLRIALEVSLALSHILGEEAVWVETEISSIVVGSQDSGRGFTFWISPFKWLGSEFESRKLSSIVTLGEELTGWNNKLVSDQAGHGLGGWLKWVRKNPDASLQTALETLATSTGKEPPPPEAAFIRRPVKPVLTPKHSSSKAPILIICAISILVLAAGWLYMRKNAEPPQIAGETPGVVVETETDIPEAPPAPEQTAAPEPETAAPAPTSPPALKAEESELSKINARAQEIAEEAAERSRLEAENLANAAVRAEEQRVDFEVNGGILSPDQHELVRTFEKGDPLKITGIVRGVRTSNSKKTVYLNFSEPDDSALTNAVIQRWDFKGDSDLGIFEELVGRKVTITGTLFFDSQTKPHYVKVTSTDHISVDE